MTYASLALLFLAAAALFAAVSASALRLSRQWWLCTVTVAAVLLVLTAAFDSLMIAIDLFRYDTAALTGLRVSLVPVEDFAWPLVAVLVLPALWEVLGRRRDGAGGGGRSGGDGRSAARARVRRLPAGRSDGASDGGWDRAQVRGLPVGRPVRGPGSGTVPTRARGAASPWAVSVHSPDPDLPGLPGDDQGSLS
jgi:lycopene cyclase domain-containing protein